MCRILKPNKNSKPEHIFQYTDTEKKHCNIIFITQPYKYLCLFLCKIIVSPARFSVGDI